MNNPEHSERKSLLKNALQALDEMQARLDAVERRQREPIAVIGVGCRFPGGANSPDAYWGLLHNGVDAVGPLPSDRWDTQAIERQVPDLTMNWMGGFLEGIDQFDPGFFGISPREADTMDPQQRLVLETAWEALENAGIVPASLSGSQTAVFLGVTTNDYAQILKSGELSKLDAYAATGGAINAAAGRLAYILGLQGPCLTVDTACSSSLVAVHLAIHSLRSGESSLAIAGGVNATLTPEAFVAFARWGMMAPDGRCKTFDAAADGFVRGEGCGILALKRLSDAQRDGDPILALVRGSAVNQDGRSSGLTVPNGLSQQKVIRAALADAGVLPAQVGYVETHGTGTELGDPIEVEALGAVLGEGRQPGQPLVIGSVKTNLGHLESASGVAGLIKTMLALQHEEIPPHLHFQQRSPKIPWPDFPVEIPTSPRPWRRREGSPRLAGVSSFGFSGTNAHVILEEAPPLEPGATLAEMAERPALVLLSARSEPALGELARQVGDRLVGSGAVRLEDAAYTLAAGRSQFNHRLALPARDAASAAESLVDFARGRSPAGLRSGKSRRGSETRVAFLFTGQGAQYSGMASRLYASEPVFRAELNRCAALLDGQLDRPLLEILYPQSRQASPLDDTRYTQPALFAMEWALAQLWMAWGVRPYAVMGHSVGELAAACLAGVFSLEDGLQLIAARARRMGSLPAGGAMAAIFAPAEEILPGLAPYGKRLSAAAYNAPDNTVVSGDEEALEEFLATLAGQGVNSRRLAVSHAFHSARMDPILEAFEGDAAQVSYHSPQIHLISNVSGIEAGEEITTPAYWRSHIRQPVQFMKSVETLHRLGCRTFLEIGPNPTLISMARRCLADAEELAWIPSLRSGQDDLEMLSGALAELYVQGVPADYSAFIPAARKVSLPTYPFERQRHWVEAAARTTAPGRASAFEKPAPAHFLTHPVALAEEDGKRIWQGEISLESFPYLNDHRVQGVAVVPATAYLEMAFFCASQFFGATSLALSGVTNHKILAPKPGESYTVQVVMQSSADGEGAADFRIYSRIAGDMKPANWVLHASGKARVAEAPQAVLPDLDKIRAVCKNERTGQEFYQRMSAQGNNWGTAFQGLERVWYGPGQALGLVRTQASLLDQLAHYRIHPALADACGHALLAVEPLQADEPARLGAFVGGGMEEVRLYKPALGLEFWAHAQLRSGEPGKSKELIGDVQLFDAEGSLISETIGARLVYIEKDETPAPGAYPAALEDSFYRPVWQPAPIQTEAELPPGKWLIFSDRDGVGCEVAKRLEASGRQCVPVSWSKSASLAPGEALSIRPGSLEDYRLLWEQICLQEPPSVILHLWNLDAPSPEQAGLAGLETAQELGPLSLLHIVQSVSEAQSMVKPRVWIVTRGAQPVGGSVPGFVQAPVWGAGRSFSMEHAELWGGMIDLDPDRPNEAAAGQILEAMAHTDEDQAAYTQGQRYGFRLAPSDPPGLPPEPFHCHPEGAYLITGGLGGLGLATAEWLSQRGAKHLILLSRTPLPPASEWDGLPEGSRLARQAEAIRSLQARGGDILLAGVDVADETALRDFLVRYREAGGAPIRGLVHAAGVAQHSSLLETSPEEFLAILRAKVQGSWLLHELLRDEPLEFFVCFSSASSVLNSPYAAAYAAANAFLDGLAFYRRSLGLPALSINWGFWADVGMAADFTAGKPAGDSVVRMMSTAAGLEALERCLSQEHAQLGVFSLDWPLLSRRNPSFARFPLFELLKARADDAEEPQGGEQQVSPARMDISALLDSTPEQRRAGLEKYLAGVVASVLRLRIDRVDAGEPLSSWGLDSLTSLEIKNQIARDSGITIPFVQFLQGASVHELAGILEEHMLAGKPAAERPREPALVLRLPDTPLTWPLTNMQQSMWFLQKLAPQSAAYNVTFTTRICSRIDLPALKRALTALLQRHPVLKSTIQADGTDLFQVVPTAIDLPFEEIFVGAVEDEELRDLAIQTYRRPFDLEKGPLFRAVLFTRSEQDHLFQMVVHHIACDGWSTGILLGDFLALYAAEAGHETARLSENPSTFGDFVDWQRQLLSDQDGERLWKYWKNQLHQAPAGLALPVDFPRTDIQSFNGDTLSFILPAELSEAIRSLAQQETTTPYSILLAAFAAYLYSLTGEEDILIGSAASGRSLARFESVVGNFINMVVIRARCETSLSFRQLLKQVRHTVLEALDHQDYPFPKVVQRMSPERQAGRSPLFQVTFDYQRLDRYGPIASLWIPDGEVHVVETNGLRLESFYLPQQEGQFELGLQIAEGEAHLFGALKYNTDLFSAETILQIKADFLELLKASVDNPDRYLEFGTDRRLYMDETMNLTELLSILRQKDIQISLDQGRLKVNAPTGVLTRELQAELVAHKAEIIDLLQPLPENHRQALPGIRSGAAQGDKPLSFQQQRLWFLYQYNPRNTAYTVNGTMEIRGKLRIECLEQALGEIVQRHQILHTVFVQDDQGQAVQRVLPVSPFELPVVDLQALPEEQREGQAWSLIHKHVKIPFNLEQGPLFRPALFRLASERYWLFLLMHHIVSDGWSISVLGDEMQALYRAFAEGQPSPLPALAIQYGDYAAWQRRWLAQDLLQTGIDYWTRKLGGPLPVLELPSDRPRAATLTDSGANERVIIAPELHQKLMQLCSQQGVTLFMLLLAAYKVLLYRYTGQTDLLVGTPVANRTPAEVEPLIGLFVNTIVMRSDLAGNPGFLQLLNQVRETALQGFAHQEVPFEMIVEALRPERDPSHTPIFQVFFTLQNVRMPAEKMGDLDLQQVIVTPLASKFDLSLSLGESRQGFICDFEYNPDLFDAGTIRRMREHYCAMLESICADPMQPIDKIPLLTEAERERLAGWNATGQEYPRSLTLTALFEAQVDRTPEAIAVRDGRGQITYAELDRRANRLAAYLRSLGAGPETPVGVSLPREIDMLASVLAIQKAGAAYVPLDPAFPADRLVYMLEDSGATVLLTHSHLAGRFRAAERRVVCVDVEERVIAAQSDLRFDSGATPDSLAYILYTSGSTGRPKGVQVLQRGLVNFLTSMQGRPGLESTDVLAAVTTLSFDIAGLELYLPLIRGARLVLVSSETAADGERLRQTLEQNGVTVMQATPATWRLLIAAGWQGTPEFKVLCGGEALPADLARDLLMRCGSLWNLYGPTETTIWSTLDQVVSERSITIGRPIANTRVYVLDSHGQQLPTGIAGELYIGGDGVARGYLNRPELTAEKFLPDPFTSTPGARMYRTGDLARWRADGRIDFLGRLDHQVKLRGFRIELGEIESVLAQHPAVHAAVVMAREDTPGEKRLAAYLTLQPQAAALTVSELRSFLQAELPDYMVPAVFTFLDEFPLTPNGKVDRRALPAPESSRPELASSYLAPQNETERILAGIWQGALKVDQVGVNDNFFELGGHSLLTVQIHQQILQRFQTDLTIAQMFQYPTIQSLAKYLTRSTAESGRSSRQSTIDRAARARAALNRQKK